MQAPVDRQELPAGAAPTEAPAGIVKATPPGEPLFRREVMAAREQRQLGTVVIVSPRSHRYFAAFACLTAVAIGLLLAFGQFTRKARIRGWLVPHEGLVRIYAPRAGVTSQLHVREGMAVEEGQPLLVLTTELQSEAAGATRREILRRLAARRDSLVQERKLRAKLHAHRTAELARRLAGVRTERSKLDQQLAAQQARVGIARTSEGRLQQLQTSGLATQRSLERAQDQRLDQAIRHGGLERALAENQRQSETLEDEIAGLPLRHQTQLAEIDRGIALLEQDMAEAEARREIVIPAPGAGTVTQIQAEKGSSVSANVPLLTIVPTGARLEAQLFSPSHAIGFVRPGQPVLIRYQAFPYQKFGHHEGSVLDVSRSAINPGEMAPHLAGFASLHGSHEPVYRITVGLVRQDVAAYGQTHALQPGMQLEADVVLERRRLYEWVLDPLYTITGKLHQ